MVFIGDCSICLESLDQNLATLTCGHMFHESCVTKCVQTSHSCPSCRKPSKPNEIIKIYSESSDDNKDSNLDSEFQKLVDQFNIIVTKNRSYVDDLTKQLEEANKKSEELTTKYQNETKLKEAAEMKALKAEVELEVNKEAFQQNEERYKNLIIELKTMIKKLNNNLEEDKPGPSSSSDDSKDIHRSRSISVQASRNPKEGNNIILQTINAVKHDSKTLHLSVRHLDGRALTIEILEIDTTFLIWFGRKHIPDVLKMGKIDICLNCDSMIAEKILKANKVRSFHFINSEDQFIEDAYALKEVNTKINFHVEKLDSNEITICLQKTLFTVTTLENGYLVKSPEINFFYTATGGVKKWESIFKKLETVERLSFIFFNYHYAPYFNSMESFIDPVVNLFKLTNNMRFIIFNVEEKDVNEVSKFVENEPYSKYKGRIKFIIKGDSLSLKKKF